MLNYSVRLIAASIAVSALFSATAFGQYASRPSLEALFKSLGVEHPERVAYRDLSGKETTREALEEARTEEVEYAVSKNRRPDGDYDVTVSLITREQMEAMRKPPPHARTSTSWR